MEYDVRVRWRVYPFHQDVPPEGLLLTDLFADYPGDPAEILDRLARAAAEAGVPLGRLERIYNTRSAQELGLLAEKEGKGDAYHRALFRAYFVENRNIAEIPLLLDLAASAGLSPGKAADVLKKREFAAAVDADWELARDLGIVAIPALVMNGDRLVGAQPYDRLERLMAARGIQRKEER